MNKRLFLAIGSVLLITGAGIAALLGAWHDSGAWAGGNPAAVQEEASVEVGNPQAVPPTATPTLVANTSQLIQKSEKLFVVIVSSEERRIITADQALAIANDPARGSDRGGLRTNIYLLKPKDLRARNKSGPYDRGLADDHPIWVVSYQGVQGIPSGRFVEMNIWIDAFTGKVYGTQAITSAETDTFPKSGLAVFDPPGLPALVLPTTVPPPLTVTERPRPYPVTLTETEKNLTLQVALQEPPLQKELAQNQYEVQRTYGFVLPQYGRVGRVHIYLKDTAVYYSPAVDLANKKLLPGNVPLITAPGQRVGLTEQEEKLARDIAYAGTLVKEKTSGKTVQGDFVVGYLNDKKEKMAVVVIYTGQDLAYHPIVDLSRGHMVSQTLKEIATFRKPGPPPPKATPTPPRKERPPTPTPPPAPPLRPVPK